MDDQTNKKSFTIPKTYTSTKDVLISEKIDSRNVTELFNDIKSCALELHFDFRSNQCQSCDIIRNPKLLKLYNERKIQMKKDHDVTERFAFHLITSRDGALNIATNGLSYEQLTFSIEKYLGNPNDGVHLSRRPDVLLASSGTQGLQKFGLLVCKIVLGKGYATIPSINNKEFSAQLHYDYHFCKIQAINKEQRHINDLLANSLVFCYQHENFQTVSNPSQILPLAILWYDLNKPFSSELISTAQANEQRKAMKSKIPYKKPPVASTTTGSWDEPITATSPLETTPTKTSNLFSIPNSSLYTSFSNTQSDPRLNQPIIISETIPLSPSSISQSDTSSKPILSEQKSIPLNTTNTLSDPRLQIPKQPPKNFYLESKTVKHALQQQKRLKEYYGTTSKTPYILIPYVNHSTTSNHQQIEKFKKASNQNYIDLEDNDNQVAFKQIQMTNQLIEHEKQLHSQEIRLRLREKRQRILQEQKNTELTNSKVYIQNGRKLLKEHQIKSSTDNQISLELLDFFANEYQHEKRPYVKRILAELMGLFIEKHNFDYQQFISKQVEGPVVDNSTMDSVMDMDLESASSQGLGDRDERFRVPTPPVNDQPVLSLPFVQSTDEQNPICSESIDTNIQIDQPIPAELLPVEGIVVKNEVNLTTDIEQTECSSNENNDISNRSRDEFVKLLTKEAFISKSPSPPESLIRGQDSSDNESNSDKNLSSTRRVRLISSNDEQKLIIETTNTDKQNEEEEEEPIVKRIKVDLVSAPPFTDDKDSFNKSTDDYDYRQDHDERRRHDEKLRSRSHSKSSSSPNSSIKESKTRSPSSSSSRASSISNRYRRYEHNRSYDYHQRNRNNSSSSTSQTRRHQRFNYNHQSVAAHPRFANMDALSPPRKGSNYTQSSRNTDRNHNSTYYNETNPNYSYYQDNYNNTFHPPPPLMSTTPIMNYSNSYDSKPSNTIERLQMFLESTNTSYDNRRSSSNDYSSSSSSYRRHSPENRNDSHWSPSRYSSRRIYDRNTDNNQTFNYNDSEELLTRIQRLRN